MPISTARFSMLSFRAMKTTEDVRQAAAEQAISEEDVLKKGMEAKSKLVENGAEVYSKA